jgi:hypothetical protein
VLFRSEQVNEAIRFEARELRPYAQAIGEDDLRVGVVYFFLHYCGERSLDPKLEPVVFIGRDLSVEDDGMVYFQDADSYFRGARFGTETEAQGAQYYFGSRRELGHVFEFERALEELMRCSLRRRRGLGPS